MGDPPRAQARPPRLIGTHRSRKDLERGDVPGPHDVEMAAIQRCDHLDLQSFCESNDRRIDRPEWKVPVVGDQLGDPEPIAGKHRFRREIARCEVAQEAHLSFRSKTTFNEIRHFGDDELRDDQRARMMQQEVETRLVVPIVLIDVRVERTRIDEERYRRASRRRICSIFRAVSRRPLLPALAAISFRRPPPRCDSIASRVTSEIVEPRRAAS